MFARRLGLGLISVLMASSATLAVAGTASAQEYGGTFRSKAACDEIGRKVTSNGVFANFRCVSNGNPAGDDGTYDLYTY